MTTPHLLRLALLGALGCAPAGATIDPIDDTDIVDTDPPGPCGAHPRLAYDPGEVPLGTYEVCGPAPTEDGSCPPAEDLSTWAFLSTALGPHPEPEFCGWYGSEVCGPVEGDGDCCYVMRVETLCEGRPLVVDGVARTAPRRARADWCEGPPDDALADLPADVRRAGADLWRDAAAAEHASVASFARAVLDLLALGAPPDLIAETIAAQADEVAHARLAWGLAAALSGAASGPGPLDVSDAAGRADPEAVLRATFREGCVNESLAAAEAREAAAGAAPPVRAVLQRIADDETRHAALAWRTVRWLVHAHPHLAPLLQAEVDRALAAPPVAPADPLPAHALRTLGRLPADARDRLARAVLREVVVPVAHAVEHGPDAARA